MTPNEATEMLQRIVSRLVGILGTCIVFGVLIYSVVDILTAQPKATGFVVTMDPKATSETYFVRHDYESFMSIATDGKKTIRSIDSMRLTWFATASLVGIGLFFFRWPIARLTVPNPNG